MEPLLPDPASFRVRPQKWVWIVWLAMMTVALIADGPSRTWLGPIEFSFESKQGFWHFWKQFGEAWFALIACACLTAYHPLRWRGAVLVVLACAASSLVASLLKWAIGRPRPSVTPFGPFDLSWFRGGWAGALDLKNLAMPSGHATQAFTLAFALILLMPRGWLAWLAVATMCAIERVLSSAHWPSDVVASAMVGLLCSRAALWFCFRVAGPAPAVA